MKRAHSSAPTAAAIMIFLGLMLLTQVAMASTGGGGSQMGSGIIDMLNEVRDFLSGDLLKAGSTVVFIICMFGAFFSGANDAIKKGLTVIAITAVIVSATSIMTEIFDAANGALV